jgi:hypothetical protein
MDNYTNPKKVQYGIKDSCIYHVDKNTIQDNFKTHCVFTLIFCTREKVNRIIRKSYIVYFQELG